MKESIIRTLTPMIVGWLASLPVINWLGVDNQALTSGVSLVLMGAYYLIGRVLENKLPFPFFGSRKQPTYEH